jgi:hypothetical protein
LDFSQITQTSLSGEGKRSQRLKEEYFYWWNQHPPKEGGGKVFIPSPKKLAIEN